MGVTEGFGGWWVGGGGSLWPSGGGVLVQYILKIEVKSLKQNVLYKVVFGSRRPPISGPRGKFEVVAPTRTPPEQIRQARPWPRHFQNHVRGIIEW